MIWPHLRSSRLDQTQETQHVEALGGLAQMAFPFGRIPWCQMGIFTDPLPPGLWMVYFMVPNPIKRDDLGG